MKALITGMTHGIGKIINMTGNISSLHCITDSTSSSMTTPACVVSFLRQKYEQGIDGRIY